MHLLKDRVITNTKPIVQQFVSNRKCFSFFSFIPPPCLIFETLTTREPFNKAFFDDKMTKIRDKSANQGARSKSEARISIAHINKNCRLSLMISFVKWGPDYGSILHCHYQTGQRVKPLQNLDFRINHKDTLKKFPIVHIICLT